MITDPSSHRQATDEEIDWWLQAETLLARARDRISAELKRFGLTQSAYLTLDRLARTDVPLRIAELASSVRLSPSSSSRLVDKLVSDGYVTRSVCASDRRGVYGHLTDHGRALHAKAGPYYRAALAQIIDHHDLINPPAPGGRKTPNMRAVAVPAFGDASVLTVATDLPVPEPGPGQIRVRTAAAAVNPTDLLLRSGAIAAYVEHLSTPYIPGMDVSGVVDDAGDTGFEPGQQVMAFVDPFTTGRGAQSEYVVVEAADAVVVPDSLDLDAAASLPMNGLTAHEALSVLDLPEGSTVVVTGATGAVGGYAVQLAKHYGHTVVAAAGEQDRELVTALGADHVVRRADGPDAYLDVLPDGADAVIDAAVTGADALRLVRDGGQLVKVRPYDLDTERGITIHRVYVVDYQPKQQALAEIADLAARGVLTPRVAGLFTPAEAHLAHQSLEKGGVRGRQLIVFRG
ncbi:alcohol dehydrogenase catalytic domain-containing protein [Streptomyces sp. WELS2]|uniref:alcohol dehydrogenase catalytic domain-containing protein n=1 Tax=Streptomyces sp. WELS2 TaxID=2749435 RepID=UPI0015EFDD0D|nr:zinc-binding dehydrogenase [Streptomyces sp. WELS2]